MLDAITMLGATGFNVSTCRCTCCIMSPAVRGWVYAVFPAETNTYRNAWHMLYLYACSKCCVRMGVEYVRFYGIYSSRGYRLQP